MAISAAICTSYKVDLMFARHNLAASGGNSFKLALYVASANLDATTIAYTATGEVSGTNYTATGNTLTNIDPISITTKALASFQTVTFSNVTISNVDGCLIYNDSATTPVADASVQVFKFASLASATAADFVVQFPTQDDSNAMQRLA